MSEKTMQEKYKKNLEDYIDIKHTPPCDYTLFCDGYAIALNEMRNEISIILQDGHDGTVVESLKILLKRLHER